MTITTEQAEAILVERNRAFMEADLDAYMAFWAEDGVMELDGNRIVGWANMKDAIANAWAIAKVMHFETRAFAVNGNTLLNEFSIVWQNQSTEEITLQTGMGTIEINEAGKWICLRDYFDASGNHFFDSSSSERQSALESASIKQYFGH